MGDSLVYLREEVMENSEEVRSGCNTDFGITPAFSNMDSLFGVLLPGKPDADIGRKVRNNFLDFNAGCVDA